MDNMYNKYFKKKLFNKMLLIYSAITVVSICLLTTIFLNYYIDNEIINELNIHSEVIYNIEKRLEEQDSISNSVINGINTQKKITDEIDVLINSTYEEYLSYKLDNFSVNNMKQIDLKYLFDTILGHRNDVLAVDVTDKDNNIAREIVLNYDQWYKIKNKNYLIRKINKPIKNIDQMYTSGYINLFFDLSSLNSVIRNTNLKGDIIIFDSDKNIVFDSGGKFSEKYSKDNFLLELNNNKLIGQFYGCEVITELKEDAQTNTKYLSVIPRNEIGIKEAKLKIYIISALCVILIIFITYLVINNYSKKLNNMMNKIRKIQMGNFDVRFSIKDEDDELDTIAMGIDQMCENLQYNINKTYVSEVKQKEAEISALQAQIKPHFLYNTLEVIRMCALAKKNTEVADMIYNLASMFRYSTYNNNGYVTIKEEIEYCRKYLNLCKIRYNGILKYTIDIEDELNNFMMPKFIIQPLVENSISHGMKKDCDNNLIKITVHKLDNSIQISILDNGQGINQGKLKEIESSLIKNLKKSNSIGLMNVNSRLKHGFGDQSQLEIISNVEKGTSIKFIIPILEDDGENV